MEEIYTSLLNLGILFGQFTIFFTFYKIIIEADFKPTWLVGIKLFLMSFIPAILISMIYISDGNYSDHEVLGKFVYIFIFTLVPVMTAFYNK